MVCRVSFGGSDVEVTEAQQLMMDGLEAPNPYVIRNKFSCLLTTIQPHQLKAPGTVGKKLH